MKLRVFNLFLIFLLVASFAFSQDYSPALLPTREKVDVMCFLKGSKVSHAQHSMRVEKVESEEGIYYDFLAHGEGTYDKFENVIWNKTSRAVDDGRFLKPLNSSIEIMDRYNSMLASYVIQYDYDRSEINFILNDRESSKIIEKKFPIKGPVCDDVTMIHFLKKYVAHIGEKGYETFYLVTNEPNIYEVNVSEKKHEILEIENVKKNTIKIQAYAEMGMLTNVMKRIFPPTYLWYEDVHPYHWVQYQGLDGGPRSANIRAVVVHRE